MLRKFIYGFFLIFEVLCELNITEKVEVEKRLIFRLRLLCNSEVLGVEDKERYY